MNSVERARLVRHDPMIQPDEEQRWRETRVAIAGMGVGAGIAIQLGLVGAGELRICDGDAIELSNLNRHPIATVEDIGCLKEDVVAHHLDALGVEVVVRDRIEEFAHAEEFVAGSSVVIEEVDQFSVKWWLRHSAKEHGVCLITATDLWDRVVIDVEDYAREPDWEPFHDLVSPSLSVGEAQLQLFGRHCSSQFLEAVKARRSGFPQFAPTAAVAAGLVAAFVRELVILRSDRYRSGRYFFDLRDVQEAR